ncbi:hypothetical protein [Pontibacter actiniarum]|uniref:Uncharacterized protein n=1 Tax=Pontibacter actiniarum TaxID=323450 RepID=A0A1X9YVG9_9BACT|nr:hypothetical protein [Pontibacter actiniarum]ARS36832.1 hypothetical protein CA264_16160 [Pontibacter actiniarum]
MKTNKKDWEKTAQDAKGDLKTGRIPDKHTGEQYRNVSDKNRNDPNPVEGEPKQGQNDPKAKHSSQGHSTDAKGAATNTREETMRSATTDSSRQSKKNTDEGPTGGNVR